MEQHTISNHQIASFAGKLQEDERSPATIENYLRHKQHRCADGQRRHFRRR